MNWSSKAMIVLEKIMFISLLNILWIACTLLGLGIFGVFPATFALFKIISTSELFEPQSSLKPIVKEYLVHYRAYFWKANIIGIVYAAIFYGIAIDKNIIQNNEVIASFLNLPLNIFLVYVIETLIFLFPIAIHTEGTTKQKIRLTIMAPMIMPKASVLIILVGVTLFILLDIFSAGIFLFYISLSVLALHTICLHAMYRKNLIINEGAAV